MPEEGWESISLKREEVELLDQLRRVSKRKEIPSRREVIVELAELAAKRQGIPA